jgi:rod shape-determining protein MreC
VTSTPGSLTQTAQVRPFADFSSLGVVGVVVAPPRTDPRDSVLPGKAG